MPVDLKNVAWWNIDKALTCQRLFNWIVGKRSGGKTYGAKKRAIEWFLKKDWQFIYLRRYDTELDTINNFFDDIIKNNEFPDHVLKVKNDKFYIDDKLAGYAIPLTLANNIKSTSFPNVMFIIFDEFIIENKSHHYLPDEVNIFIGLCNTIIRKRSGVKIFCLANAITISNPYFMKLKLIMPKADEISLNDFNLVENFVGGEINENDLTEFERFMLTTEYGEMALKNKFMLDNPIFIEKKPASVCIFTITYDGVTYGVWRVKDYSRLYVSYDIDPSATINYALTTDDHQPNTMLIKQVAKHGLFKLFLDYYKNGSVRFENINIKNMVIEAVSRTL